MNNFAVSILASSLIYTCSIDPSRRHVDGPFAAAGLSRRGFFDPVAALVSVHNYSAQFLKRIFNGRRGKEHYHVMFQQGATADVPKIITHMS
jgi:hypothetical protein